MGILEGLEKIVSTASRIDTTVSRGAYEANRAKGAVDTVGKAMAKKCKFCKGELKTDAEKSKGVCANCALERM